MIKKKVKFFFLYLLGYTRKKLGKVRSSFAFTLKEKKGRALLAFVCASRGTRVTEGLPC